MGLQGPLSMPRAQRSSCHQLSSQAIWGEEGDAVGAQYWGVWLKGWSVYPQRPVEVCDIGPQGKGTLSSVPLGATLPRGHPPTPQPSRGLTDTQDSDRDPSPIAVTVQIRRGHPGLQGGVLEDGQHGQEQAGDHP